MRVAIAEEERTVRRDAGMSPGQSGYYVFTREDMKFFWAFRC